MRYPIFFYCIKEQRKSMVAMPWMKSNINSLRNYYLVRKCKLWFHPCLHEIISFLFNEWKFHVHCRRNNKASKINWKQIIVRGKMSLHFRTFWKKRKNMIHNKIFTLTKWSCLHEIILFLQLYRTFHFVTKRNCYEILFNDGFNHNLITFSIYHF